MDLSPSRILAPIGKTGSAILEGAHCPVLPSLFSPLRRGGVVEAVVVGVAVAG
jgi:hypothetical protein